MNGADKTNVSTVLCSKLIETRTKNKLMIISLGQIIFQA